jgi:hydroxyethylthiazole kinase-like uncharacterized protein yjeF
MKNSQPILLGRELRAIEERSASQGAGDLMQRAGLAAAEVARAMLGDTSKSVLVLCGPGNNGGDAFEVACHLKDWFYRVTVFFPGDPAKLPVDAKRAHAKWVERNGHTVDLPPEHHGKFDLVVDGLFGVGLARAPEGIYADAIEYVNLHGAPVLALDVPSGIDADTGTLFGHGDRAAICAEQTVTFIAMKPGLLMLDGAECSGEIQVADLGLPAADLGGGAGRSVGTDLFARHLKPRPRSAHKGDMGSVAIIGGAAGMTGAVLLAGRAALKLGAGRVYCGLADRKASLAVDLVQPELMLRPASTLFESDHLDTIVIGPGLGQSTSSRELVAQAIGAGLPMVADADALNLIAGDDKLAKALAKRKAATLITPHAGEAARLLGSSIAKVQADRIATALELAGKFNATALLKGAGSLIATPDGRWYINTSGNPGMATAGMGDVLSGLLGALLAQGWDAEAAMLGGVHLHGCAADRCVKDGKGPAGLTASEVIDAARTVFNIWSQRVT